MGRSAASHFAEVARSLQRSDGAATNLQCIGVTSCASGEGVSTVAAHLASHLSAISTERVLLVEANLIAPSLQQQFNLPNGPGLRQAIYHTLNEGNGLAEIAVHEGVHGDLHVLAAGQASDQRLNDRRLVRNLEKAARQIIGRLRPHYPRMVFDLPSMQRLDALLQWAPLMDGVLLVMESNRHDRQAIQRAKRQLERAGVTLVGIILNKHRD